MTLGLPTCCNSESDADNHPVEASLGCHLDEPETWRSAFSFCKSSGPHISQLRRKLFYTQKVGNASHEVEVSPVEMLRTLMLSCSGSSGAVAGIDINGSNIVSGACQVAGSVQ